MAEAERLVGRRPRHAMSEASRAQLRRSLHRRTLVAALFLVLAGIELWSPIVGGRWYSAADLGQLAPLTRNVHSPARAANPLQSDVYSELDPFLAFDVREVRSGELPTWNPYNGNGQPFMANYQSGVFSPFTWFFYVLGFPLALVLAALARLWLAGFFMFLLLARHRICALGAAVGAVVFMFAGYHVVWQSYPIASVSAWLAPSLWCARVALDHRAEGATHKRKRRLSLIALGLCTAGMLLAGNPETATFDILLVCAYVVAVLVAEHRDRRVAFAYVGRFAGAGALGAGLSAVQLLAFSQYEHGSTFASAHNSVIPGFNLSTIPMLAFPNLFGGPQFSYYDATFFTKWLHPLTNYAELDGNSVGLVAVCLVAVGVVALWQRRHEMIGWFGAGAALVGTLLLYSHAAGYIWEHLPVVGTAYLNRSQDVELTGVAVLAALGVDWAVARLSTWRTRPRSALVAGATVMSATIALCTVLVLWALALRRSVSKLHGSRTNSPAAAALAHDHLLTEAALAGGLALVLVTFALLGREQTLKPVLALGAIALVFCSNGLAMSSYNPAVPSSVAYPRTAALVRVQKVVGSAQTLFADGVFPTGETSLWFSVHDVSAYDSVGLALHDRLYDEVFGTGNVAEQQMPRCLEGLQLFGVKWVIGGNGAYLDASTGPQGALEQTGQVDGIDYYAVPGGGMYSFVANARVVTSGRRALGLVSSCGFRPDDEVVLDESPGAAGSAGESGARSSTSSPATSQTPGTIRLKARAATGITVETYSSRSGWVVIRQSWAPGWVASVDGHGTSLLRADYAFDAVEVPAGHHVVELSYRPTPVALGAWISIVSLVVLVGLVSLSLLARR